MDMRGLRTASPAHAGIDPGKRKVFNLCARFPRTRGDRPQITYNGIDYPVLPPHTRG